MRSSARSRRARRRHPWPTPRFRKQASKRRLRWPAVVSADALDVATAEENHELLERVGLEIVVSGPNELTVRSAPVLLASGDVVGLARSLLKEIREYGASQMLAGRQNELLA